MKPEIQTTVGHTPGPWTNDDGHIYGIVGGDDYEVCDVAPDNIGINEMDAANAQLIAAAPDLLAACKAVYEHMAEMGCDCPTETTGHYKHCVLGMVEDAIAKATP